MFVLYWYECTSVVVSWRELTCMHCVYLAHWPRKVLCGICLYAIYIYIYIFIHLFIFYFASWKYKEWNFCFVLLVRDHCYVHTATIHCNSFKMVFKSSEDDVWLPICRRNKPGHTRSSASHCNAFVKAQLHIPSDPHMYINKYTHSRPS